jgi:hypothetical protein
MNDHRIWIYALVSIFMLIGFEDINGIQEWDTQYAYAPLLERFTWKTMDFAYPDERTRQLAIASGEYIPENSLPVGIEIWRSKLFVTIPRWRDGECPRIL